MNFIEKWIAPFRMGTTTSITMQSLGDIAQYAPAVAAKMWCLLFFVCHAVLWRGLCIDFDDSYSVFSKETAPSDALHSSHICC